MQKQWLSKGHSQQSAFLAALHTSFRDHSYCIAMAYDVIFDVTAEGYRTWWFPVHGLLLFVIGIVLLRYRAQFPAQGPLWLQRSFPYVFLGLTSIWTVHALWVTLGEYKALSEALRGGKAEIVEGTVTLFVPQPKEGKRDEKFCVLSRCFYYSAFVATNAYNKTANQGGVIKDGLLVRVHHINGQILRLEVKS